MEEKKRNENETRKEPDSIQEDGEERSVGVSAITIRIGIKTKTGKRENLGGKRKRQKKKKKKKKKINKTI